MAARGAALPMTAIWYADSPSQSQSPSPSPAGAGGLAAPNRPAEIVDAHPTAPTSTQDAGRVESAAPRAQTDTSERVTPPTAAEDSREQPVSRAIAVPQEPQVTDTGQAEVPIRTDNAGESVTRLRRPHQEPSRRTTSALSAGEADRNGKTVSWLPTELVPLAMVLGVVGIVFYALRRWMPSMRGREGTLIRTVARATLTPKHSVALLHLPRRFVLVGIGPDRVTPLCDIRDPEEVAALIARTAPAAEKKDVAFEELLREQTEDEVESVEEDASVADEADRVRGSAAHRIETLLESLREKQRQVG
jgi:flagellar biogenesis protein FliO